ncbi:MAG: hypothetical protein IJ456_11225 [Bacteroides sp.]|nr:hypothetical protein [Bacteroides sp.]
MKPSKQQKAICELIKSQASFWMNSNDIDSPTHVCDIDEEVSNLELDEEMESELSFALKELYYIVKGMR